MKELMKFAKALKITIPKDLVKKKNKKPLVKMIRKQLLYLEQTNTSNISYLKIPRNHPIYPFPLNIKDRIEYIHNLSEDFPDLTIEMVDDEKTIIAKLPHFSQTFHNLIISTKPIINKSTYTINLQTMYDE